MPIRKIPKSYRNVTGISSSKKSIGAAGFESTLERDVIQLMEFDPNVKSFEVQPVRIKWIDDAQKERIYTPDLLVNYFDKKPILYEIKYIDDITSSIKEFRKKFKTSISFATKKGWRFKFYSNQAIDKVYLKNVKFLLPFLNKGVREENHLEMLDTKIREFKKTTPKKLLNDIFSDEWNQAELMPSMWYMVATQQIGIDLNKPLNMNSKIWSIFQ